MRSAESSGTPATTRKRARNQTSAAGSLSLLAVPKLKVNGPTPPPDALDLSRLAAPKESIKSEAGTQIPMIKSPKQRMRTAAAAMHRGKENGPVTLTQPAQASTMKLPAHHASTNKPTIPSNNLTDPKHTLPVATRVSRTPRKASNLPAPGTSDRLSATLQHSVNKHGPSMTAGQLITAPAIHSAMSDPTPAKHDCAGVSDSAAICAEADQALTVQDVPLACHTAINKRRYDCGASCPAAVISSWYLHNSRYNIFMIARQLANCAGDL